MRKVYLTVHVPLIVLVDEGVSMQEVIDNLQIEATIDETSGNAQIEEVQFISKWDVTDSK
jgi:hypothetical protein